MVQCVARYKLVKVNEKTLRLNETNIVSTELFLGIEHHLGDTVCVQSCRESLPGGALHIASFHLHWHFQRAGLLTNLSNMHLEAKTDIDRTVIEDLV